MGSKSERLVAKTAFMRNKREELITKSISLEKTVELIGKEGKERV